VSCFCNVNLFFADTPKSAAKEKRKYYNQALCIMVSQSVKAISLHFIKAVYFVFTE
jgi:hypothetical protein